MSTKKKSSSSRSAKSKAKVYVSEDEEEAFTHTFDVVEKLKSKNFPKFFVKEMRGDEVRIYQPALAQAYAPVNIRTKQFIPSP